MKEILIVRHAKSSWSDYSLADIERPLNERGKKDAPAMAAFLFDKNIIPEKCISSPAKRARKTAKVFSKRFYGTSQVDIEMDLYHGHEDHYLYTIQQLDERIKFAALFGHNPMINNFVSKFSKEIIYNIPTTGVVHLQLDIDKWSSLNYHEIDLINYYFPKEVL